MASIKDRIIQEEQFQQEILNPESFYLSFKFNKLCFSPISIFQNIRKKIHFQRCQSVQDINSSQIKTDQKQTKFLFIIQIKKDNKGTFQVLSDNQFLGQIHQIFTNRAIYQYPLQFTQVNLKNKEQISFFSYNFSPNNQKQLIVNFKVQLSNTQILSLGQCRIDPNIFISLFFDQGIKNVKDRKQLMKKISQQNDINQNIDVQYEIFVEKTRLNLERSMKENRKGIKILDFKEHIRQILIQRQKFEEEYKIKNEEEEPNKSPNERQRGNTQNQFITLQVKTEQQGKSQKQKKGELQDFKQDQGEQHVQKGANSLEKRSQFKVKGDTTKNKFQNYLKKYIESNLSYFNAQKPIIQQEIDQILYQQSKLLPQQQFSPHKQQKIIQNGKLSHSNLNIGHLQNPVVKENIKKQNEPQKKQNMKKQERRQSDIKRNKSELEKPVKVGSQTSYMGESLKILLFVIISLVLMYYVMRPSRNVEQPEIVQQSNY